MVLTAVFSCQLLLRGLFRNSVQFRPMGCQNKHLKGGLRMDSCLERELPGLVLSHSFNGPYSSRLMSRAGITLMNRPVFAFALCTACVFIRPLFMSHADVICTCCCLARLRMEFMHFPSCSVLISFLLLTLIGSRGVTMQDSRTQRAVRSRIFFAELVCSTPTPYEVGDF